MIDFSQFNTYTGESQPPQPRQRNVRVLRAGHKNLNIERNKININVNREMRH